MLKKIKNWFKPKPEPKPKKYMLDWDKVKSTEDMQKVISSMFPSVHASKNNAKIGHLLKEVEDE